jgi:myosin heavy subunit
VKRGELDTDNFRVGLTKVFFKAGILARMEEFRDTTLSNLFKGLQACIRWGNELVNSIELKNTYIY